MSNILELRQKIDLLDTTLVNILNERAQISLDVGAAKRNHVEESERGNLQVYKPTREKEIYAKLSCLNSGPLRNDSLHAIYREIMSASIALQGDVCISYLGPPGTFSHQAALKRFGNSVNYTSQKQIKDVFESVEKGQTTYGIIPFENSIFGPVVEALDCFIRTSIKICAETYLPIHLCLLSNSKLENITKVYSHLQGLGETQKWLSANIPNAVCIAVKSTAEAAEKAASETGAAAVCSELCSKLYGLDNLETNIEDATDNTTRFFIIGSASDSPTDDGHTLITLTVDHRQPSALSDSLNVFKVYGINLLKIDSRPSGQRAWHYVFFIECSSHFDSERIRNAVKDLENFCLNVVILGSFPSQKP